MIDKELKDAIINDVYIPNTSFYLLSVPDFRIGNGAQMIFKTEEEQQTFFNSKMVYKLLENSYQRIYKGSITVALNADALLVKAPNYLMFQNGNYSNKWFYANILEIIHISEGVTNITYSIDAWQTFMFQLKLDSESYVVRRTWSGTKDDENDLMNLPFEELDIGNNYVQADLTIDFNDTEKDYKNDVFYYLTLTKPLKAQKAYHLVNDTPDIKYVEVVEGKAVTKTRSTSNGVNSVTVGYVFNYTALNWALENDYFQSCDTNGTLQQVLLLPFGSTLLGTYANEAQAVLGTPVGIVYSQQNVTKISGEVTVEKWCSFLNDYINRNITNNWDFSDNTVYENVPTAAIGKYMYRFPYSMLEASDFSNQPYNFQLEHLNSFDKLKNMRENKINILKYGSIGTSPLMTWGLKGYKGTSSYRPETNLVSQDISSFINVLNTNYFTVQASIGLPILSDYLSSFLQSNLNQINATKSNLRNSFNTAISNAGTAMQAGSYANSMNYQNNMISVETSMSNAKISNNTQFDNAQRSNMVNAGTALLSGIGAVATFSGSPAMGLGLGINAINQGVNVINNDITNRANYDMNNAINANNYSAGSQIASNNQMVGAASLQASYAIAARSAATSYENSIRSVNAKLQDAGNIPDSLQSQGNNSSMFNVLNNRDCIQFRTKVIEKQPMQRLIDYFSRYGFLTNRTEKISEIIEKFDTEPGVFIQTINANVGGTVAEEYIKQIKAMFDGGICLFKPESYLRYDQMKGV